MINILVEGMTENKGGKETFIVNTFNYLNKEKYKFYFISYNEKIVYEDYLKENGAVIVPIPPRYEGYSSFCESLKRVFETNHIDILWSHKTSLSSCELIKIAKKKNVPIRIVHSHSSANMGNKLTYILHNINRKLINRWANKFVACSKNAAEWFFDDQKDVIILKNAIDLSKYQYNVSIREKIRRQYDLEGKFVVGHVGRFGKEKNHQKLLDVFLEIHKQNKNTTLLLCGDGEERNNIEKKIDEYALKECVIMTGIIENVHEILQAFDVFVMPSFFEGLPFVLLEAQAAGLKCIVSDTISKEADITCSTKYLPLESSNIGWANEIMKHTNYERENAYMVLKEKGFDLKENIKIIESLLRV